jgi:hypothetical protein
MKTEYPILITIHKDISLIMGLIPRAHSGAHSVQASWGALRTKSGRLWTPKLWGKRENIFNDSLSILIYPNYYYTFDILINLMVYLAE